MMRLTLPAAAFGLLLRDADPFCKTGIVSTDLYSCCPASCGSCDDANEACTGAGGDLAAQAQGGCCPGKIKGSEDYRQCDLTRPPCQLGDDYRNPPGSDALDILANTERHARDDCNEAIPKATKEMRMSIQFAHKPDTSSGGTTIECGTYASQPIHAAAAACSSNEDCVGFTSKGDSADCLLVDFKGETASPGNSLYIKVKNQAGHTVVGGIMEYYSAGGAASAEDAGLPEIAEKPSDIKPDSGRLEVERPAGAMPTYLGNKPGAERKA